MIKLFGETKLPFENKEEIILRDHLALERTKLANERTLFAYIRTALYLILAGMTILQLNNFESIHWIAFLSIGLSIIILIVGIWRYSKLNRQLKYYYSKSNESEKAVRIKANNFSLNHD
jgi:putative membrane protein